MKTLLTSIFIFVLGLLTAQNQLEVAGDAKIDGKLDLDDGDQNVLIGRLAAPGIANTRNVFVGNQAGRNTTSGALNTFVGHRAGFTNQSGQQNVYIGFDAGSNNIDGNFNTIIGIGTGRNNLASHNTYLGFEAGTSATTGRDNVYLGSQAGAQGGNGSFNTMVGRGAGRNLDTAEFVTAMGFQAGYANRADANTFVGAYSGLNNTAGTNNVFYGASSGYSTTSGGSNTFIGIAAGFDNLTGSQNVYVGSHAGRGGQLGLQNTYVGFEAGCFSNVSQGNTFMGWHAGYQNTNGRSNVYLGLAAGANASGSQNVFVGYTAGSGITTNTNNTALGYEAKFSANWTNSTVIGAGAICNANNKVRIGNSSVQVIEGQVMFSAASDRRLKENITECSAGLAFIEKLRPVQYNWKEGHGEKRYTGFIAQEVESAAQTVDFDFSAIVVPEDEEGHYSLRYAEFVVPLVKAVQELNAQNADLRKQVEILIAEIRVNKTDNNNTAQKNWRAIG